MKPIRASKWRRRSKRFRENCSDDDEDTKRAGRSREANGACKKRFAGSVQGAQEVPAPDAEPGGSGECKHDKDQGRRAL